MDKDHEGGEVFPTMKNFSDGKVRKLNYIIHNPNTVEETAKVLLDVLIQANAGKVERKLQELSDCDREISELKEYDLFSLDDGFVYECLVCHELDNDSIISKYAEDPQKREK